MTRILAGIASIFTTLSVWSQAQETWVESKRVGTEARFLFEGKILRFDLETSAWLGPFVLPRANARAMAADADGNVVVYRNDIYRYDARFEGETFLGSASSIVDRLFLDGDLVIAAHPSRAGGTAGTTVFDRADGTRRSPAGNPLVVHFAASHAPMSKRLFGRTAESGISDIHTSTYTAAGTLTAAQDSPYNPVNQTVRRTWVFPDEHRVVEDSGAVYSIPGLYRAGSFGGTVTDIAFRGDAPVVLRGGELIGFSHGLRETGRYKLSQSTGAAVHIAGDHAFVFHPGTGTPTVEVVDLDALKLPESGASEDPNGLIYNVDGVFPDKRGDLLLFSRERLSLFRWSPTARAYTDTRPLRNGVPVSATYTAGSDHAWFGYDSLALRRMDMSQPAPAEQPVTTLTGVPTALQAAGDLLFAVESTGRQTLLANNGSVIATRSAAASTSHEWDPTRGRMYNLGGSNLVFTPLDPVSGFGTTVVIGSGLIPTAPPIRLSQDGSHLAMGNGMIIATGGTAMRDILGADFTDAAWSGESVATIRSANDGTVLESWSGARYVRSTPALALAGSPVRILHQTGGFVVITSVRGEPCFTLLNDSLEILHTSPTRPLAPTVPKVGTRTESSVEIFWSDASDNEDGFRIDYRSPGGIWASGATAAADTTVAVVTGLSAGTEYEFRVAATNGILVSPASPVVTAATLVSGDEPSGEPYHLHVTRVFENWIQIEWDDHSTNETGFRIYRSSDPADLGTLFSLDADSVSFTDTGLVPNTAYYYRVQAVNGSVAGDLSAQVQTTTNSVAIAPKAPILHPPVLAGPNTMSITWLDLSYNEEEFIIERAIYPAMYPPTTWTEVGRVEYDREDFLDTGLQPATTYRYRVKASNGEGAGLSSVASGTTPPNGNTYRNLAAETGSIRIFAFSSPDRLERYDLVSRAWLAPVPLEAPATALWADASGIYVAEGRSVIRFDADGTGRRPLFNERYNVANLVCLGETLIYRDIYDFQAVDARNGTHIATLALYADSGGAGYSVSPVERTFFYQENPYSTSTLKAISVDAAGTVTDRRVKSRPTHQSLGLGTHVTPDGTRVIDSSGAVYASDTLTYQTNIGAPFTDLSFDGPSGPLVLRGDMLLTYGPDFLETGTYRLAAAGLKVETSGSDALVFTLDNTTSNGLRVDEIPLASIVPQVPGPAPDPRGLAYTPDDVFPDRDGQLLILSKDRRSVFRWSPDAMDYTSAWSLNAAPAFGGYDGTAHRLLFAYPDQVVRHMDLATPGPSEAPLFNLANPPLGFTVAGGFPYVATSPVVETFTTGGERIPQVLPTGINYYGSHNVWDPNLRRIYHFRDGTSPNDLHFDRLDEAGQVVEKGETPYHGTYSMKAPIRVSPDGGKVIIGSGVVFETVGLTRLASIANEFTDACWFGGQLVTARLLNGGTQIQTWSEPQFTATPVTVQITGTPVRLLPLDAERLLLICMRNSEPCFVLLDQNLVPTATTRTTPLPPAGLRVAGRSANSVDLEWQDMSDNEDGFLIQLREPGGEWTDGPSLAADSSHGRIADLPSGIRYEFQVISTLDELRSAPSARVTALTLTGPDQPVGEPYGLWVSRRLHDSLTLEWTDNADNETAFQIFLSTTSGGDATVISVPAGTTSRHLTGLAAGTTYFLRIQVVNGTVLGDLSAETSATTLPAASAPTAPTYMHIAGTTFQTVTLGWQDNSTNEDRFAIERRDDINLNWVEIGSAAYNSTSFTDAGASPGTHYYYRISAVNAQGSSVSNVAHTTTPRIGGTFAGHSRLHSGILYLAFNSPDRIERYDLAARDWLAPLPLGAPLQALWVDDDGVFAAEDRTIVRFDHGDGARQLVASNEATVRTLFTLGPQLFFGPVGTNSQLSAVDKNSGVFQVSVSLGNTSIAGTGPSVVAETRRAYIITPGSPTDIRYLEFGPDGSLVASKDSPFHNEFAVGPRTILFPDKERITDPSGIVYSTATLEYAGSLGGEFTDLAFHEDGAPVVLRGQRLVAYDTSLRETGGIQLGSDGLRLAVSGQDAIVFRADAVSSHGMVAEVIALSSFAPEKPAPAVDPRGLVHTPDDAFVDASGNLLLFSKEHKNIFRWSTSRFTYLPSLPLTGTPVEAAHAASGNRLFTVSDRHTVRMMDLDDAEPSDRPFCNLPGASYGFTIAGDFPYFRTRSVLLTYAPDGATRSGNAQLSSTPLPHFWDPARKRVYHLSNTGSAPAIQYENVDAEGRLTTGSIQSVATNGLKNPFFIREDGGRIATGDGSIFNTTSLTRTGLIDGPFPSARWAGDTLLTIRAAGADTSLQRWDTASANPVGAALTFAGAPFRILPLAGGRSALVTIDRGMPRFFVLGPDLVVEHDYVPDAADPPAAAEDEAFRWVPDIAAHDMKEPIEFSAPHLPGWLRYENGVLSGTPREADAGSRATAGMDHRVVLRAVDAGGRTVEREATVRVAWRNDAPSFTREDLDVTTDADASPRDSPLAGLLVDSDMNDPHVWKVATVSNPALFSGLQITAGGTLRMTFQPQRWGNSEIRITATDGSGASAGITVRVTLPRPLPPEVVKVGAMRYKRYKGHYIQKVTVKNTTGRSIPGFQLVVAGLKKGESFLNATKPKKTGGMLDVRKTIAAGGKLVLTLEFEPKKKTRKPKPRFKPRIVEPAASAARARVTEATNGSAPAQAAPASAPSFAITDISCREDGAVALTFPSQPGFDYQIEWTSGDGVWKSATGRIEGTGSDLQWVDEGPPHTDEHPSEAASRQYRIRRTTR